MLDLTFMIGTIHDLKSGLKLYYDPCVKTDSHPIFERISFVASWQRELNVDHALAYDNFALEYLQRRIQGIFQSIRVDWLIEKKLLDLTIVLARLQWMQSLNLAQVSLQIAKEQAELEAIKKRTFPGWEFIAMPRLLSIKAEISLRLEACSNIPLLKHLCCNTLRKVDNLFHSFNRDSSEQTMLSKHELINRGFYECFVAQTPDFLLQHLHRIVAQAELYLKQLKSDMQAFTISSLSRAQQMIQEQEIHLTELKQLSLVLFKLESISFSSFNELQAQIFLDSYQNLIAHVKKYRFLYEFLRDKVVAFLKLELLQRVVHLINSDNDLDNFYTLNQKLHTLIKHTPGDPRILLGISTMEAVIKLEPIFFKLQDSTQINAACKALKYCRSISVYFYQRMFCKLYRIVHGNSGYQQQFAELVWDHFSCQEKLKIWNDCISIPEVAQQLIDANWIGWNTTDGWRLNILTCAAKAGEINLLRFLLAKYKHENDFKQRLNIAFGTAFLFNQSKTALLLVEEGACLKYWIEESWDRTSYSDEQAIIIYKILQKGTSQLDMAEYMGNIFHNLSPSQQLIYTHQTELSQEQLLQENKIFQTVFAHLGSQFVLDTHQVNTEMAIDRQYAQALAGSFFSNETKFSELPETKRVTFWSFLSEHKKWPLAKQIFETGYVQPEMKNIFGQNLLHIIATLGAVECLQYFVDHPQLNNCIAYGDQMGDTPLHIAARFGHTAIWCWLIEHSANWNSLNLNGETPLAIALQGRYIEMIKFLFCQASPNRPIYLLGLGFVTFCWGWHCLSEKERAYLSQLVPIEPLLFLKLVGHAWSLDARLAYGPFISTLTGNEPYTLAPQVFQRLLEFIQGEPSMIGFKETIKCTMNMYHATPELIAKYVLNGGTAIVPAFGEMHVHHFIFTKTHVYRGNRGAFCPNHFGVISFSLHKPHQLEHAIRQIQSLPKASVQATNYFNKGIIQDLDLIEDCARNFKQRSQKVGNCVLASLKSALWVVFFEYQLQQSCSIPEAHRIATLFYKRFTKYLRTALLQELIQTQQHSEIIAMIEHKLASPCHQFNANERASLRRQIKPI